MAEYNTLVSFNGLVSRRLGQVLRLSSQGRGVLESQSDSEHIVGQLKLCCSLKTGKSLHADSVAYGKMVQVRLLRLGSILVSQARRAGAVTQVTYHLSAKGTPYIVSDRVCSDTATVAELSKLNSE